MTATATSTRLKLPRDLADLDLKFGKALNAPLRELWPDGEKFLKAEQPEAIAAVLIRTKLHERLVNAKIAYLFRAEIASRGDQKLTVSGKAGGKLAFLAGVDFTENVLRGVGACAVHARKTTCLRGHPYDEANTIRRGRGRECRRCREERERQRPKRDRRDYRRAYYHDHKAQS